MTYMRANYKWRTYASLSTGSFNVVHFNAETCFIYFILFDFVWFFASSSKIVSASGCDRV